MTNSFEPWPKNAPKYHNACTDPCDCFVGPCVCGATHQPGEFELKGRNLYRNGEHVARTMYITEYIDTLINIPTSYPIPQMRFKLTEKSTVKQRLARAAELSQELHETLAPILSMYATFAPGTDWWHMVAGNCHIAKDQAKTYEMMSKDKRVTNE